MNIKNTFCVNRSSLLSFTRVILNHLKYLLIGTAFLTPLHARTIGSLLWEENFNSLNAGYWNVIEGDGCDIGLCGWGNQELENYRANNVTIETIPGEMGNMALVLEARQESFGAHSFTSGKIDSENGVSVHYGMIETRIRVPNVDGGLWPAFWMLGTSTATWPAKGELDIMEMGHSDQAIASHGHEGTPQNQFVGANAIYYSEAACVVGNETCAASTAWQTDNAYVSTRPMNDRFIIYRLYWTDSTIRFTAIDEGVEYDMYDAPIPITAESSEFQQPFFFLMNLAVGGTFNGLLTPGSITATLPAKMYVDYIRVYELDGMGEVVLGNPTQTETGTFGVFTDRNTTNNQLEPGVNAEIYVWNQDSIRQGTLPPYEGDNVIAWEYTNPGVWFGGGIQSHQVRDMSQFADGTVTFWIKTPQDVSFRVGITDSFTNQNWLVFPANETKYGLVRNGEWGQVSIPVSDLRGELIALQSLEYLFAITSVDNALPTFPFQLAIDDILWLESSDNTEKPRLINGVVEASSNLQHASLALDGDQTTRWESLHGFGPAWFTMDLGASYQLSHIDIFWEAANADTYVVRGSNDKVNWTEIASYSGGTFGDRLDTLSLCGSYRYIQIDMLNRSVGNYWGYSIFELNLYGVPGVPLSPAMLALPESAEAIIPTLKDKAPL